MGCWYCRQFLTPLCHNATLSLKLSEVFSSALHKSSHSSQSSAQFVIKYSDSCWTHSRDRVSPLTTKWLSIRENPRCSGSDGGLFQWNSGSALATDEALATVWFPSLNVTSKPIITSTITAAQNKAVGLQIHLFQCCETAKVYVGMIPKWQKPEILIELSGDRTPVSRVDVVVPTMPAAHGSASVCPGSSTFNSALS